MMMWPLTVVFSVALLVSAGLLFSVQPMISKMVLPALGGAPAVWITAMVFFQGALLAGYAYAYASTKYFSVRTQIVVHLALLLGALYVLPIGISDAWGAPDLALPQVWLITVLLGVVALPFIVTAGSATLLQNWFSQSRHPHASDPYFLYAASNAGSIIALLAYPTVLEPTLALEQQSSAWSLIYIGFIALALICGAAVWKSSTLKSATTSASQSAPEADDSQDFTMTWAMRLQWTMLAFAPSMMLLGVTLHIQTDIASIPFLWVMPLTIYLLTFVITFYKRQFLSHRWRLELHAGAMILLTFFFANFLIDYRLAIALHIAALFFSGLVCTGHLGEFYLWLAAGGWLGGVAGGLIAPLVFDSVLEYPLAIVLVCLLRAAPFRADSFSIKGAWIGLLTLAFFFAFNPWLGLQLGQHLPDGVASPLLYTGLLVGMLATRNKPILFALLVGSIILTSRVPGYDSSKLETIYQVRSFFGINTVLHSTDPKVDWNYLFSGSTLHGMQAQKPYMQQKPIGYYHRASPIGQLISGRRQAKGLRQLGDIGLGPGALACHMRAGEKITFFEIDPTVISIATNPEYFSYLDLCGNKPEIVVGDGRLRLAETPDAVFDILVLDAFSSDSIPVHLLTREALSLYLRKVTADGIIAFHISNRHLDLAPVLARLAADFGLAGLRKAYRPSAAEKNDGAIGSDVVVVAMNEEDLQFLNRYGEWFSLKSVGMGDLWTDNSSNVLGTLKPPE
jgi:hypothetical protein